jgi:hypothetical protein
MKKIIIFFAVFVLLFALPKVAQAGCSTLTTRPASGDTNTVFEILAENCTEPSSYSVRINNTTNVGLSRQPGSVPTYVATLSGSQLGVSSGSQTFSMVLLENGSPTSTTGSFTVNAPDPEDSEGGGGNNDGGTTTSNNTAEEVQCDDQPGTVNTAIGCVDFNDINSLARFFIGWALGIAGGVALLMIGFAAFRIATSQGNPQRLQGGQELLLSAIGGLLMVVLSVFLLRFIGVDLLGLF